MESYHRHQGEVSLLMSHFFIDYLRDIYRQFDGDLALVIVLGEIAHHNLANHFPTRSEADRETLPNYLGNAEMRARMPACNAYSLAAATGMPRETIRRKIARLVELGWVERPSRREIRITDKVSEHFLPDFNVQLLTKLLITSDRIRGVLTT